MLCRSYLYFIIVVSIYQWGINILNISLFTACESGKYGNGCSGTCFCFNQPCDPIHGMCPPGGCTHGYKELNCSTGM